MPVLLAERRMMEVLIAELNLAMEESSEKLDQLVRKSPRARRSMRFTQRLGRKSSEARFARVCEK